MGAPLKAASCGPVKFSKRTVFHVLISTLAGHLEEFSQVKCSHWKLTSCYKAYTLFLKNFFERLYLKISLKIHQFLRSFLTSYCIFRRTTLRKKFSYSEFFLVRIFPPSDQTKKLRIGHFLRSAIFPFHVLTTFVIQYIWKVDKPTISLLWKTNYLNTSKIR